MPKYLALLEAGGSDSPESLLKPLGVRIQSAEFLAKGIDKINGLVKKLEALLGK